jgi:hypothetical protein
VRFDGSKENVEAQSHGIESGIMRNKRLVLSVFLNIELCDVLVVYQNSASKRIIVLFDELDNGALTAPRGANMCNVCCTCTEGRVG